MRIHAVALFVLASPLLISQEDDWPLWRVPETIANCLVAAAPSSKSQLMLDSSRNPYYLRGDFDGDGKTDLAIALKSKSEPFQVGIGICRGTMAPVLLGSIARGKRFTEDAADMVTSPGWRVITRKELIKILASTVPQRHRQTGILYKIADSTGEMIYMPYETEEGVIYYWHGSFRWYVINSSDLP